jgi:uncharacterized protein YigE (DUF2233 family)
VTRQSDPFKPRYGLELVSLKVPSGAYSFQVEEVKTTGIPSDIFTSKDNLATDIVSVNGGFFAALKGEAMSPMGLVISNGKLKRYLWHRTSGGIVFSKGGSLEIVPAANFEVGPAIANAIQSTPLLMNEGTLGIHSDSHELANRVAIATYQDGSVGVVGAFQSQNEALSLCEFALLLGLSASQGGVGASSALAMDGGPGAHIFIPRLKLDWGAKGVTYMPNIVRFRTRAK